MGIRSAAVVHAKQMFQRSLSKNRPSTVDVPKCYFPVYVGENRKRFVVPVSYLKQPSFQNLLQRAEEEFGLDHQKGGVRVPCEEDYFPSLTSQFSRHKREEKSKSSRNRNSFGF